MGPPDSMQSIEPAGWVPEVNAGYEARPGRFTQNLIEAAGSVPA
jgi:hypothetical protein